MASIIHIATCCRSCGEELAHKCTVDNNEDIWVEVSQCEKCGDSNYDTGFAIGWDDRGSEDGANKG